MRAFKSMFIRERGRLRRRWRDAEGRRARATVLKADALNALQREVATNDLLVDAGLMSIEEHFREKQRDIGAADDWDELLRQRQREIAALRARFAKPSDDERSKRALRDFFVATARSFGSVSSERQISPIVRALRRLLPRSWSWPRSAR